MLINAMGLYTDCDGEIRDLDATLHLRVSVVVEFDMYLGWLFPCGEALSSTMTNYLVTFWCC